jgi:hypothetical protein
MGEAQVEGWRSGVDAFVTPGVGQHTAGGSRAREVGVYGAVGMLTVQVMEGLSCMPTKQGCNQPPPPSQHQQQNQHERRDNQGKALTRHTTIPEVEVGH